MLPARTLGDAGEPVASLREFQFARADLVVEAHLFAVDDSLPLTALGIRARHHAAILVDGERALVVARALLLVCDDVFTFSGFDARFFAEPDEQFDAFAPFGSDENAGLEIIFSSFV